MSVDISAVKKAYRDAALKNHPDKNRGNALQSRFKCVQDFIRPGVAQSIRQRPYQ
ncbi:J domain-containing protein [Pseudomonas syringae group genomosp. 3]|nr:J domain-containing protein [Pseudomonas syringae group genomosp. 3]